MRQLTFKGYLRQYVLKLSYGNTLNIHKLVDEIHNKNHRLKEPLFLYCRCHNKSNIILKYLTDAEKIEYLNVDNTNNRAIQKVYESFNVKVNMPQNDKNLKLMMWDKISKLQASKHISTYRIQKDLKLDGSNLNAFLKNKNVSKLSADKAMGVIEYLENC